MLFNLLTPLADDYIIFNLFRYLTFRSGGAVLTALVISFVVGPRIIQWLKAKQGAGQPIRDDGPESHVLTKAGTPTMGGFLILLALCVSTLLWADLTNGFVWAILYITIGFGTIGFADDMLKLTRRSSHGLPSRFKLLAQIVIGTLAVIWLIQLSPEGVETRLAIPFLKNVMIDLGWFFGVFGVMVLVGASNAVNLTDGLDGLAIVPVMIAAGCFALIAYLAGNAVFASYLQIHYVAGTGELAVFCGALVGASLGFLWFNAPPAMVLWATPGRCRWAARWAAFRSSPSTSWCSPSSVACSSSKPCPSSSRWLPSSSPAGACSVWRRCTITSKRRVGRSRPS